MTHNVQPHHGEASWAKWLRVAGFVVSLTVCAAAARAASPFTQSVFDAADQSYFGGTGLIGVVADNANESLTWGTAYHLRAYAQMYRATSDLTYLDKFITQADWALSKRNDYVPINTALNPAQAHYKRNGQNVVYNRAMWASAQWGYDSASIVSGHIVEGMARFARLVAADPTLAAMVYDSGSGATYGDKAAHYLAESIATINAIDTLLLINTTQGTGYKAFVSGGVVLDGANALASPSAGLFDIYQATGDTAYLLRAQRTMRTLRNHARGLYTTEQGNLAWTYWFGNPPASDPEDVSHASHVAPIISSLATDRLLNPGLYTSQDFTEAQARAFAKTLLEEAYQGSGVTTSGIEGSNAFGIRLGLPDYSTTSWAWGWAGGIIDFAQFDLRLLPVAEAVQLHYYNLSGAGATWPMLGIANLVRYNSVPRTALLNQVAIDGVGADYHVTGPVAVNLTGPTAITLVNDNNPGDTQQIVVELGGEGDEWLEQWRLKLTIDATGAPSLLGSVIALRLSLLDGYEHLKEILSAATLPLGYSYEVASNGHEILLTGVLLPGVQTFVLNATELTVIPEPTVLCLVCLGLGLGLGLRRPASGARRGADVKDFDPIGDLAPNPETTP